MAVSTFLIVKLPRYDRSSLRVPLISFSFFNCAVWFHVAQALQSLSMTVHTAIVGCGFGMLFNVFDKQSPRTVLSSVCLLVLNCEFHHWAFITFFLQIHLFIHTGWVLLTQLGVVGVNLDLEKKQTGIQSTNTWMSEADQSSLSWSFGLAAFALLFVLIALNILVWCVYPRKWAPYFSPGIFHARDL